MTACEPPQPDGGKWSIRHDGGQWTAYPPPGLDSFKRSFGTHAEAGDYVRKFHQLRDEARKQPALALLALLGAAAMAARKEPG